MVNQGLPQWGVRANALGLNEAQRELYELLVNFHAFTHEQYVCLKDMGGYDTLLSMQNWRHKDIYKWCSAMRSLNVNRGGRTFQENRVRILQGIAWFVTDCTRRGKQVDVNDYKDNPEEYKLCAETDYQEGEHDAPPVSKPEKFSYKTWIEWEESVYTYFDSMNNSNGVSLAYVIRKDLDRPLEGRKEEIIYNAPHEGYLFQMDNKKVGDIIRELCLGTEAEAWLGNKKGGKECMTALRLHYDGSDEAERRLTSAKARLEKLYYRAEATFPFEKYVTTLTEIYNTCERYNQPMYESDKLKYLLNRCQNNHSDFKQEVNIARSSCATFLEAVTYLKTVVARLFPDGQRMGGKRRYINNVNKKYYNKKGGHSKRGEPRNNYNGVDTSDLSRWYSDEEWQKLPRFMRKKIRDDPDHKKKNHTDMNEKTRKRQIKEVSTSSTGKTADDELSPAEKRIVAATITGLAHMTSKKGNGAPAGRAAVIAKVQKSTTYDHLGNEIE